MSQKIVYGIKDLKKNERYATMSEAAKAKQIRYWGLKKVDTQIIVPEPPKKPVKDAPAAEAGILGKTAALLTRAEKIKKQVAKAKEKGDTKEVERLIKEYDKIREEYKISAKFANEYVQQQQAKLDKNKGKKKKKKEKEESESEDEEDTDDESIGYDLRANFGHKGKGQYQSEIEQLKNIIMSLESKL